MSGQSLMSVIANVAFWMGLLQMLLGGLYLGALTFDVMVRAIFGRVKPGADMLAFMRAWIWKRHVDRCKRRGTNP